MTKTDNILKLILILKTGAVSKNMLLRIIGKSKAQTYKLVTEFSQATDDRPAVLVEYTSNGRKYVQLSSHYGVN
jgi:chromosome segregation and condensation protein ScpB